MIVLLIGSIIVFGVGVVVGLSYLHHHHPETLRWLIPVAAVLAPWWLAYQRRSNPQAASAMRRVEEHPAARIVKKLDGIFWPLIIGAFLVAILAWLRS